MSTGVFSTKQWRFESVDLRAGMGIVLWRHQRGAAHVLPPHSAPALFFSPPHFQPEPIVSIAVALSACRGTFEPGLYLGDDDVEVSFSTPEEVTEFLRRAYISGAGGDGGDGGDLAPVPPVPGGDDGDPVFPQKHDNSVIYELECRIHAFKVKAKSLQLGASAQFLWDETFGCEDDGQTSKRSAHADNALALVTAGLAVLSEILGRMPDRSSAFLWLRWHDDVRKLSGLLCKLGVAELLITTPYDAALRKILLSLPYLQVDFLDDEERYQLGWMLLFGPPLDPTQPNGYLRWFLREQKSRRYGPPGTWAPYIRVAERDDPLDTLMRLPLPKGLHVMLSEDMVDKASLYHLLNVFVANPQSVGPQPVLAVCLVLFAAACITAKETAYYSGTGWPGLHGLGDEIARRATEHAYVWLLEHMPQRVFAEHYETILGTVKSMRYFTPD